MPKSRKPRRPYTGRFKDTHAIFVPRREVDEIQALFREVQLIVEVTLPRGACTKEHVAKMRDMLNFTTVLIYAGKVFDRDAFDRNNGALWRNFQERFLSYYSRTIDKKIFTATGDELRAFQDGFEVCGTVVHDELEAEPVWCLKCFSWMKSQTDGPEGRISLCTLALGERIRKWAAKRN